MSNGKLLKSSISLPAISGLKLEPIPEHSIAVTPPVDDVDSTLNTPITDQEKLDTKLGLLRDMVGNLEAYKHYEDEHANVTRQASRLINEFLNDIIHVHNMVTKIVTDLAREAEAEEYPNVDKMEDLVEHYNAVLSVMLEVPLHIKTGINSQALSRAPANESAAYKADLESKLAKSIELRVTVESKISGLENKIEMERRAPLDDFTLVSRRKSIKNGAKVEEPNPYDTRPKRYQSARY
ncbi:hypothetical protein TWF281_002947 [Arthrobotrys megalospora]